jgi:choline dehydrogenase-like flavoprotein
LFRRRLPKASTDLTIVERDFDAIVIGSGAGGAGFAHACALAGKSVLMVERGRRPTIDRSAHDERSTLIEKHPYDDRSVQVNDVPTRLYMGGVLGGGTSLFGGAMLRPSADDFQPGKHFSARLDRCLWDWPVSYEELRPYYDAAESLYALTASSDDSFEPLQAPSRCLSGVVLPMAPINERLMAANRAHGLRPFRLPLAIDASRCEKCPSCAGFLCPHGARRSACQIVDETASRHSLRVMTNTEVERLQLGSKGEIEGVVLRDRDRNTTALMRSNCYALAAGAIASPAILLRSGIDGPHVGRNFMMHYSPIAVGVFAGSTEADQTFVKQVGFADYYFGTPTMRDKMGIIQSLPAPGPLMLAKSGLKHWPRCLLQFLRKRMLPLAGIVEDLPNPANRVALERDGSIGLRHDFSDYDRERGRALAREMRRILRRAGAVVCSSRSFPSREHVAHQCGTLRSGRDPKHAVVDADCRMFDWRNLFVVDGSVLPTSMGVGPSLTIVANALRVARVALESI